MSVKHILMNDSLENDVLDLTENEHLDILAAIDSAGYGFTT